MEFSKLRGQHFLTDKNIVKKIIDAAELVPDDAVLEVGPGLGAMTREILPAVGRLIAVELDPFFVHELRKEFGNDPRIEIVEGDILKMRILDVIPLKKGIQSSLGRPDIQYGLDPRLRGGDDKYKLITNLPYNITSAFLKKFLIEPSAPERIVVMLQKEVAERIVVHEPRATRYAPMSLLGLMCNLYAECGTVCKVPAGSFVPPPKIDSTVICLKPYSTAAFSTRWGVSRDFSEDIVAFASKFFVQPRKKMCGMLGKGLREKCQAALREMGENPDSRPAVLTIEKWVELWKKMR